MTTRIAPADDHLRILAKLSRLADEVAVSVQDGGAAMAESLRVHPDVIVLDPAMPVVGV